MRKRQLWKKAAAAVLTAAMLLTGAPVYAEEAAAMPETEAEAVSEIPEETADTIEIPAAETEAGEEDAAETPAEEIPAADAVSDIVSDADIQADDEIVPEDAITEADGDFAGESDDEAEALNAEDDQREIQLYYSYTPTEQLEVYGDEPLEIFVGYVDNNDPVVLGEGERVKWNTSYTYYKEWTPEKPTDSVDFINEELSDQNRTLTLTLTENLPEYDYCIITISAEVLNADGETVAETDSDMVYVKPEWYEFDVYHRSKRISTVVGGEFSIADATGGACHRWTNYPEGEYVDCDVTITADGEKLRTWIDTDEDCWNGTALVEGEIPVTITASYEDETIYSLPIVVAAQKYGYNWTNEEGNEYENVLPGEKLFFNADLWQYYIVGGNEMGTENPEGITLGYELIKDSDEDNPVVVQKASYDPKQGFTIDTTGLDGGYDVCLIAYKDGAELYREDEFSFSVSETYYELSCDAYLFDPDNADNPVGPQIDLQYDLFPGDYAIIYPTVKKFTKANPQGEVVESGVRFTYCPESGGDSVTAYWYNAGSALVPVVIDSDEEGSVVFAGEAIVLHKEEQGEYGYEAVIGAYIGYDEEEQDYEAYVYQWLSIDNDDDSDIEIVADDDEIYGEFIVFDGYPITVSLRDCVNDRRDFSRYNVKWSLEMIGDQDETAEADIDEILELAENGPKATLTAKSGRPEGDFRYRISAEVSLNGRVIATPEETGRIEKPETMLEIYDITKGGRLLIGEPLTIPSSIPAYVQSPTVYGRTYLTVKDISVKSCEPADAVSVVKGGDGWTITAGKQGWGELSLTYPDPATMKDEVYSFYFSATDNLLTCEVDISDDQPFLIDGSPVTVSAIKKIREYSNGTWKDLPDTGYHVKWEVTNLQNVEHWETDADGNLSIVGKLPEDYDGDSYVYAFVTAVLYRDGEDEWPLASTGKTIRVIREGYNTSYGISESDLSKLMVGEKATLTPVVKYYDSAHPDGVEKLLSDFSFSFYYENGAFEITDQDGHVIGVNVEPRQLTSFSIKRLKGSSKYLSISISNQGEEVAYSDFDFFVLPDCSEDGHSLTRVPAKAATTSAAGNIEYWRCGLCGKLFSDAAGTREITQAQTVIPKPNPAPSNVTPTKPAAPTAPAEKITINKKPSGFKAKAAKKGKVTVTWKKFKVTKKTKALWKKIKKIEVQYSTDPFFKTGVTKKMLGKKKTKLTLKLAAKTKYYVRIRYYDGIGYSNWVTKSVKTK